MSKTKPFLPCTAAEWDLYVRKPGAGAAARAMTEALDAWGKAVARGDDATKERRAFHAVTDQHANLGARDSEPIGIAERYIDAIHDQKESA